MKRLPVNLLNAYRFDRSSLTSVFIILGRFSLRRNMDLCYVLHNTICCVILKRVGPNRSRKHVSPPTGLANTRVCGLGDILDVTQIDI